MSTRTRLNACTRGVWDLHSGKGSYLPKIAFLVPLRPAAKLRLFTLCKGSCDWRQIRFEALDTLDRSSDMVAGD